jgi:PTH2 family peptidyl-tRNA hydrolase
MYYKQVIVVNKELGMTGGKLSAQVSHGSMAFLTRMIQANATKCIENRYAAWEDTTHAKPQLYKRNDLNTWAKEARERGDDYFYAKPVDPNDKYGELELCAPNHHYECHMNIDKDLYEQWMGGLFTKVILSAKNEAQMQKIVEKAKDAGMVEGREFFCIRDACLTELTPDETGTRWTCIGFAPMDAEKIDSVTGKLQLYRD